MQDEINEKTIVLSIRGAKITARILQQAIKAILAEIQKGLVKKQQTIPHGEANPKTAYAAKCRCLQYRDHRGQYQSL